MKSLAMFTILLACSCAEVAKEMKKEKYEPITKVIDGCEYLEVEYGHFSNVAVYSLTHKGNCSNPIHVCR